MLSIPGRTCLAGRTLIGTGAVLTSGATALDTCITIESVPGWRCGAREAFAIIVAHYAIGVGA